MIRLDFWAGFVYSAATLRLASIVFIKEAMEDEFGQ